jgi:hypothetical protein
MKRNARGSIAAALALVLGLGCPAAASAVEQAPECDLRLALTFTPDVPNAQSPGFLGAILSDPQYRLTWLNGTDTQATVELTGPGPSSQCQAALNRLSRDAHVLNVQVLPNQQGPTRLAEGPAPAQR